MVRTETKLVGFYECNVSPSNTTTPEPVTTQIFEEEIEQYNTIIAKFSN